MKATREGGGRKGKLAGLAGRKEAVDRARSSSIWKTLSSWKPLRNHRACWEERSIGFQLMKTSLSRQTNRRPIPPSPSELKLTSFPRSCFCFFRTKSRTRSPLLPTLLPPDQVLLTLLDEASSRLSSMDFEDSRLRRRERGERSWTSSRRSGRT